MRYLKYPILFCAGGTGYMTLELLWRGWSHGSMFLAGGTCFLLLGKLKNIRSLPLQGVVGAAVITGVELAAGLVFNRNYTVWDYRSMPFSFQGQICLPFSLLWVPVSLGAVGLYRLMDATLLQKTRHFY